jgi:hypothetical protein
MDLNKKKFKPQIFLHKNSLLNEASLKYRYDLAFMNDYFESKGHKFSQEKLFQKSRTETDHDLLQFKKIQFKESIDEKVMRANFIKNKILNSAFFISEAKGIKNQNFGNKILNTNKIKTTPINNYTEENPHDLSSISNLNIDDQEGKEKYKISKLINVKSLILNKNSKSRNLRKSPQGLHQSRNRVYDFSKRPVIRKKSKILFQLNNMTEEELSIERKTDYHNSQRDYSKEFSNFYHSNGDISLIKNYLLSPKEIEQKKLNTLVNESPSSSNKKIASNQINFYISLKDLEDNEFNISNTYYNKNTINTEANKNFISNFKLSESNSSIKKDSSTKMIIPTLNTNLKEANHKNPLKNSKILSVIQGPRSDRVRDKLAEYNISIDRKSSVEKKEYNPENDKKIMNKKITSIFKIDTSTNFESPEIKIKKNYETVDVLDSNRKDQNKGWVMTSEKNLKSTKGYIKKIQNKLENLTTKIDQEFDSARKIVSKINVINPKEHFLKKHERLSKISILNRMETKRSLK